MCPKEVFSWNQVETRNVYVKHYAPNYMLVHKKMPKFERGITLTKCDFFQKLIKLQASAQIVVKISCYQEKLDKQTGEQTTEKQYALQTSLKLKHNQVIYTSPICSSSFKALAQIVIEIRGRVNK